jgi:hypothetical protein
MTMRKTAATLALILAAVPPTAAQDVRIPQTEQDADRIEAQAMYDRQRQRDQAEADRVAKTNLGRKADYELYLAKQKAEHEARMAQWRADVARQKAEYEARVAKCIADKTCAPR